MVVAYNPFRPVTKILILTTCQNSFVLVNAMFAWAFVAGIYHCKDWGIFTLDYSFGINLLFISSFQVFIFAVNILICTSLKTEGSFLFQYTGAVL